jgi:hypothetical protein
VGDDRRAWLRGILAACDHAIAELAPLDNPDQRHLLADLIKLRDRLRAELDQT